MESINIIIIGSNEPALLCASTARKTYPDKTIGLINTKPEKRFLSGLLKALDRNETSSIKIIDDQVDFRKNNHLQLKSGKTIEFEKLILSTGADASTPNINGIEKQGVYLINKDPDHINEVLINAINAERIAVYGAGYIGVEISDELLQAGKQVILIERSNRILPSSFDSETSFKAKKIIEEEGGTVYLNAKVREVLGIDSVTGIRLRSGEIVDCDCLLICSGSRPNIKIADSLGVIYDRDRGILVDEYFRTSDKNIYAIGDCAAKFDFYSGDLASVLLTSIKKEEAKLLGSNLYSVIYNRGKMVDYLEGKRILNFAGVKEISKKEALLNEQEKVHL